MIVAGDNLVIIHMLSSNTSKKSTAASLQRSQGSKIHKKPKYKHKTPESYSYFFQPCNPNQPISPPTAHFTCVREHCLWVSVHSPP